MSVKAVIILRKDVENLDKAEDWYEDVKELLQGNVTCSFSCEASNPEPVIELTEEPPDG